MTGKNMRVNARLDRDRVTKFNYIRQRTNQGASEIMKVAIDLYYEKLHQESPVKPLQLLMESGLIGCAEGDSDLSVNYKQYLTESLNEKYGHR
ncbi:ribbon-helix-helix domain-containing protein [Pseudanabaena sp. FACHB-1998]|uniref:ribbon-helix-helix domain-containing protein n=1 Tax=Pseudanabaena sp. FACHB-1998 TaxID=2692858 RepID=UPI0018EF7E9A|nr:ribbon-helix-helix domain-containing protein [Pseudanabaena sp. FACHB-1998]